VKYNKRLDLYAISHQAKNFKFLNPRHLFKTKIILKNQKIIFFDLTPKIHKTFDKSDNLEFWNPCFFDCLGLRFVVEKNTFKQ
jgi:hypothetical protein